MIKRHIKEQIDIHNIRVFLLLWKSHIKTIKEQIQLANKIVKSWPRWKQNILEQSLKSTVYKPRPYINNLYNKELKD